METTNRIISVILGMLIIILAGCGDEEGEDQGIQNPLVVPNPLQIEISMVGDEEEELAPVGSITGRILFTDSDGQIQAYPLASYEYVIPEGTSRKVSGKNLTLFVDFPSNNSVYLMAGGYFQITDVEPGTHKLILVHETEVPIMSDAGMPPEDGYTEIDVPPSQWTVTVEPDRNTTMDSLIIPIPDMPPDSEWSSGDSGQEIVIPEEPETPTQPPVQPPVVPTRPTTKPLTDPDGVVDGHVYLLDDIRGNEVPDDSANNLSATIVGAPQVVQGFRGMAMKFDGVSDGIHIPDDDFINTGGPWPNRTVMAIFNCADVSKANQQMIYDEGGATRGINIYVQSGNVYVGIWNRAEYNADLAWEGSWPSAPIRSNEWYAVALVLRDAPDEVADDKFEMWLNGVLITREPSGQIYGHSADNGIGYTNNDTYYPGGSFSGEGNYFEGMIDEIWILNQALSDNELKSVGGLGVERMGKLASSWGVIKSQR
jgi:hypothetical protein